MQFFIASKPAMILVRCLTIPLDVNDLCALFQHFITIKTRALQFWLTSHNNNITTIARLQLQTQTQQYKQLLFVSIINTLLQQYTDIKYIIINKVAYV